MKKDIGIYVHIPFCMSKCYYCDFVSYSNKKNLIKKYVQALVKEIRYIKLNKYNIKTIYIGGGTPSILDSEDIVKILNEITKNRQESKEVTIEVNPGTVNEEKLKNYKKAGVNRLSIGLQVTDNFILGQIGRIHKYEDFLKTYKEARKIRYNNINVDLMLALPNQTIEILTDSLQKIIDLKPEHISLYSLILEENTKLYNMVMQKKIELPSEEEERQMYWKTKNILEENGYIHYEISNFAKKGYKSKHNSDCWKQKEYIGIGAAAHSYLENKRFSNIESVENYIENINNGNFKDNVIIHEIQSKNEKQKEYMLLGLRKIEGININEYKNIFGENPIFQYSKELNKLTKIDLLKVDGNYIKLTNKGLDLANIVLEQFI